MLLPVAADRKDFRVQNKFDSSLFYLRKRLFYFHQRIFINASISNQNHGS